MRQPRRTFRSVLALAILTAACGAGEPSMASRDVAHDDPAGHDHTGADRRGREPAVHESNANDAAGSTRLTVRAEDERIVLEIGPVDLPAVPDGSMRQTPLLETAIPVTAMLTGFDVRIVDGRGNALPQSLLHHVNVMLPERRDLFRPVMQRLVAAGSETSAIRLPWPFGVRVDAGEPILAYAMLHSDAPVAEGPVTVQLRLRYDGGRRRAVQPFFIDASPPPGPGGWDLPPGRSERSWEGRPAVDGRILGVGGHLHRYGTELVLEDVTAGRVLVRLRPQLRDGELVGVERRRFLWRLGIPLKREHTYRITAYYDNPTGRAIPEGAMGSIAGMMTVDADAWPEADRSHPSYDLDIEWLSGVHGHSHGQHE